MSIAGVILFVAPAYSKSMSISPDTTGVKLCPLCVAVKVTRDTSDANSVFEIVLITLSFGVGMCKIGGSCVPGAPGSGDASPAHSSHTSHVVSIPNMRF